MILWKKKINEANPTDSIYIYMCKHEVYLDRVRDCSNLAGKTFAIRIPRASCVFVISMEATTMSALRVLSIQR